MGNDEVNIPHTHTGSIAITSAETAAAVSLVVRVMGGMSMAVRRMHRTGAGGQEIYLKAESDGLVSRKPVQTPTR